MLIIVEQASHFTDLLDILMLWLHNMGVFLMSLFLVSVSFLMLALVGVRDLFFLQ